jgi:AcrR family transcriptional regulator
MQPLKKQRTAKRKPGRPKSDTAVAHDKILDVVFTLLKTRSIRKLTIDEVCRRAGVSKPTIYKWWPTKAAMVMEMFEQRMVRRIPDIETCTAEQLIRVAVPRLIQLFNEVFGKVAAEMIAEGQSDAAVLREFRERYMLKRRAISVKMFKEASKSGEFKCSVDPELLSDLIFGPIYYRLLVKHQPLNQEFGTALVEHVLGCIK